MKCPTCAMCMRHVGRYARDDVAQKIHWCPICGTLLYQGGQRLTPKLASLADDVIKSEVGRIFGVRDEV